MNNNKKKIRKIIKEQNWNLKNTNKYLLSSNNLKSVQHCIWTFSSLNLLELMQFIPKHTFTDRFMHMHYLHCSVSFGHC